MSFGVRAQNPSGVLVLDSNATHHRFHSKPAVYAAGYYLDGPTGSVSYGMQPTKFRVTTGSSPPVVFIRPEAGKVSALEYVTHLAGGEWEIGVHCVSIAAGWSEDMRSVAIAAPQIYVFAPMQASSETHGLRLFNGSGETTFDSGFRPLWIRQGLSFPLISGGYNSGSGTWASAPLFNGDSLPVADPGTVLVAGSTHGFASATIAHSGEPADNWRYGWTVTGSSLVRHRFWYGSDRSYHTLELSTDDIQFDLAACTVAIARSSNYD